MGEHPRMIRAMRCMTEAAVLGRRFVLPDVRAAFLCMALIAGIVQGLTHELQLCRLAVRTVTPAAIHLAFRNGMRKCFQRLAALQLVTVVANLRLRRWLHNRIAARVADVTVRAGDVIAVVRAAVPAEACIRRMTAKAHTVLHGHLGRFM